MELFREIYSYREMIYSLVRKDLRGRYKGSVLGFLWTFVNPLLQLMVYNFVFSSILTNDIEKYYLYLFVALIPWFFFSSCLTAGSRAILGEKGLVTKIYFPREVLPLAYTLSAFVNMLLCFLVVFGVVIVSGVPIYLTAWLLLPFVMIVELILAMGITFIASSITVYFRDLEHILGIVSMAWFYVTPIVYAEEIIPQKYLMVANLNPMTPIIRAYRDILYYARVPQMTTLIHSLLVGLGGLLLGVFIFYKLKRRFAEEM